MPPLDPHLDFEDDGGTRAWRSNHATWRTILADHARKTGHAGEHWSKTLMRACIAFAFLCLAMAIAIPLLCFALWVLYAIFTSK